MEKAQRRWYSKASLKRSWDRLRGPDEAEIARLVALVDQAFAYAVALDKAETIANERAMEEAKRNH